MQLAPTPAVTVTERAKEKGNTTSPMMRVTVDQPSNGAGSAAKEMILIKRDEVTLIEKGKGIMVSNPSESTERRKLSQNLLQGAADHIMANNDVTALSNILKAEFRPQGNGPPKAKKWRKAAKGPTQSKQSPKQKK